MQKVLIANRGEIACRVMRSCRALGLKTVAVYSEADAAALHVSQADEAHAIGPAPAKQSYLAIDEDPGGGQSGGGRRRASRLRFPRGEQRFRQGRRSGGPDLDRPDARVDRRHGRQGAGAPAGPAAGVPILPGSARFAHGDLAGLDEAARVVGFPLLVKASAGGGGIGMRRVDKPEDLAKTVEATQALAEKSFGDGTIYLERLVAKARHIEIQVFGFGDGRAVHMLRARMLDAAAVPEDRRGNAIARDRGGNARGHGRCSGSAGHGRSAIAAPAPSSSSSMPRAAPTTF